VNPRTAASLVLAALVSVGLVACVDGADGIGGIGGIGDDGDGDDDGGGAGVVEDPGCVGPLGAPQDPSTLTECCPDVGGAHCVSDIPAELQAVAAECDGGGYCVPDPFISTGGVFTPLSCASIGGAGVCLSLCIPAVAEQAPLLPQDVCGATEKCVPCISPLDDLPTGACEIAFSCPGTGEGGAPGHDPGPACDDPATCEYDLETTCMGQPVADPAAFAACPSAVCGSGGHCVPASLLPADQVDLLADCDATAKCVPDALIETGGLFTPPTCASVGGAEGRCLSACLPDVAGQAALLPTDICQTDERCVPCFDPFDGTDTGACTLSCDAGPTQPPKTFAKCCEDKGGGTCLPIRLVGAEAAEQLDAEECQEDLEQAGSVCVPDALYQAHSQGELFNPMPCETGFFAQLGGASEEGACLPDCIPEVGNTFGVAQTDCEDGWGCVPCTDQNGEDTGACQPQ
jgi:hypothetical protein